MAEREGVTLAEALVVPPTGLATVAEGVAKSEKESDADVVSS